MGFKM